MKRKINRVGQNTLTVSLPSTWIKTLNLKQGEDLEVIEEGDKLILGKTASKRESKKISYEIKLKSRWTVRKFLFSSYKNGYDEIEFHFKEPEILTIISEEVQNLLGFEIISQRKDYCLIKNVASPLKESFPDLVNKAFLVTISMAEDVFNAFKKGDNLALASIKLQESTQNKLCLASLRTLQEYKEMVDSTPTFTYFIISDLEAVADDLKYICDYYSQKKIFLDEKTELFFNNFLNLLKEIYNLYLKFDFKVHLQMSKDKHIIWEGSNLIETAPTGQKTLISYLFSAYMKLFDINRETFYRDIEKSQEGMKNPSFFTSSTK